MVMMRFFLFALETHMPNFSMLARVWSPSDARAQAGLLGNSSPIINGGVVVAATQRQSLEACDHPAVPIVVRAEEPTRAFKTVNLAQSAQD
jgi:hypothetical protein